MTVQSDDATAISARLDHLAQSAPGDTVSLDWILKQMEDSAFGLFLLVLALPCCIPFLYGVPQVVAVPLMFIAAQIAYGRRHPWLPEKLAAREVSKESLESLAARAGPRLRRIEAISHPRLSVLTRPPLDRVVGLALVLFCGSILFPAPLTNTVPGFAVVIVAMGLLMRDGLLVLAGSLLGTAWIAALIFAGVSIIALLRSWLGF